MSLEGYEVVEAGSSLERGDNNHSNELREKMFWDDSRSTTAMGRARRAESTAKALEAILLAKSEQEPIPIVVSLDGPEMRSEDYRSRLLSSIEESGQLRGELADLLQQQHADSESIESLQQSLERLHTLVSEYRIAKDETDKQLMELADVMRSHCVDSSVSVDEFKRRLLTGSLVVTTNPAGEQEIREELENQLSKWAEWSEQVTAELASKDNECLNMSLQISGLEEKMNREAEEMEKRQTNEREKHKSAIFEITKNLKAKESERSELDKKCCNQRVEIEELGTKIIEWSVWAESVTREIEAKDSEISSLVKSENEKGQVFGEMEEEIRNLRLLLKELEGRMSLLNREAAARQEETERLLQQEVAGRESEIACLKAESVHLIAEHERRIGLLNYEAATRQEETERLFQQEVEGRESAIACLKAETAQKDIEIEKLKQFYTSPHSIESSVEVERRRSEEETALLEESLSESQSKLLQQKDLLESQKSELEQQSGEMRDMETKLSEWAAWAESVSAELKLRDETEARLINELHELARSKDDADVSKPKIEHVSSSVQVNNEQEEECHILPKLVDDGNQGLREQIESAADGVEQLEKQVAELTHQLKQSHDRNAQLGILIDENELLKLQLESMHLEQPSHQSDHQLIALQSQLAVRDATIKALYSMRRPSEQSESLQTLTEEVKKNDNGSDCLVDRVSSSPILSVMVDKDSSPRMLSMVDKDSSPRMLSMLDKDSSPFSSRNPTTFVDQESSPMQLPRSSLEAEIEPSPIIMELENARVEIDALKEKVAQLIIHHDAVEDARVHAEESVTLLTAYRDEIDRLSKENALLRTHQSISPHSAGGSWWMGGSSPISSTKP